MKPSPTPIQSAVKSASDMHDPAEEIQAHWFQLAPLLEACRAIETHWLEWDRQACRTKSRHIWVVLIAASFGTTAVLLAIWQLTLGSARPESRYWFAQLEFGIAVITLASVLAGIYTRLDHHWIRTRFRAEQCRFLKFAFLRRAAFWLKQSETERQEFLNSSLRQLADFRDPDIKKYVRHDIELKFEDDLIADDPPGSGELAGQLSRYWIHKRIGPQTAFFERAIRRLRRPGVITKYLLPDIFFLSLGCVVIHFAIDWYLHVFVGDHSHGEESNGSKWLESVAWIALFLAASLPVLALGIRAVRSAFEFDRNENRFHGAAARLHKLAQALQSDPNSAPRFDRVSREVEHLLRTEHHAWVRLMTEAEWF